MFVQIFKGPVEDADAVRSVLDDWLDHLAPGATGWAGSTGGITDDGVLVAVGQFTSAEEARRNSERPEQGEWWSRLEKLFTGPVVFHNCTEVEVGRAGGSPSAGFVQVIQGRTTDAARMRALGADLDRRMADRRPDLLGVVVALHDEDPGAFTQVAYFTSEEAARRGEQEELTGDEAEAMGEMMSLVHDVTYLDLRDPWLDWPRSTGAR